MKWNIHNNLEGKHAFMSPSGYSWLNYTPEKICTVWNNQQQKTRGTILHEMASTMIKTRTKAAPLKKALNMFVNDSIGFNMSSEILLYYSDNCFGTADSIRYDGDEKKLMIFDLKTGVSKPSFSQLDIYAALFCLEYKINPKKLEIVERIYQGNGYTESFPEGSLIKSIMTKIVELDETLTDYRIEIYDNGGGYY